MYPFFTAFFEESLGTHSQSPTYVCLAKKKKSEFLLKASKADRKCSKHNKTNTKLNTPNQN